MSATERAVIYVDAGSDLSSLNSLSSSSSRRSSTSSPAQTTNNYVIKIQIGEETMFNPVRINVAASGTHHHRQMSRHPIVEPGEESPLNSSGQSSPRSDMTPPPPTRLNPGNIGSLRFGSETSESDTESDVSSAEYHNSRARMRNPIVLNTKKPLHSAAQFAMRELIEMGPGSIFPISGNEDSIQKSIHGLNLNLKAIPEGETQMFAGSPPFRRNTTNPAFESLKSNLNQSLKNVFSGQEKSQVRAGQNTAAPAPSKPKVKFCLSPEPPMTEFQIMKSKSELTKSVGFVQQPKSMMIQDQGTFHVNELDGGLDTLEGDDGKGKGDSLTNFAGYKDIFSRSNRDGPKEIMSDKGTIRGVKNRVRDGIATFLQSTDNKNFAEKERGRCVVYITSMGVVRDTHTRCHKVRQILKTLLVKYDERDCYMNREVQDELRDRLPPESIQRMKQKIATDDENWGKCSIGLLPAMAGSPGQQNVSSFTKFICLPQVFIEGQYLGDADVIEKLNESGELRKILKPYKATNGLDYCGGCGGFRMMPCPVCSGSKKSVHRNHFTEEFVALKCMHCNENGLVRCGSCNAKV